MAIFITYNLYSQQTSIAQVQIVYLPTLSYPSGQNVVSTQDSLKWLLFYASAFKKKKKKKNRITADDASDTVTVW